MPWFQQLGSKYQKMRGSFGFTSIPKFTQRDQHCHEKWVPELRRSRSLFIYIYKEKKQEVPYGQDFSWEAVTSETGDLSKGEIRVLVCTCAGNYAFVSQVC